MIFEGALSKLKQCLIWLCFPEKYNLQGPPCTELRANVCLWQRIWISMPFLPEGLKMRTKAQSALPPPAGAAPLTQNGPLALRLQNYFTQLLGWEAFFKQITFSCYHLKFYLWVCASIRPSPQENKAELYK